MVFKLIVALLPYSQAVKRQNKLACIEYLACCPVDKSRNAPAFMPVEAQGVVYEIEEYTHPKMKSMFQEMYNVHKVNKM